MLFYGMREFDNGNNYNQVGTWGTYKLLIDWSKSLGT